MSTGSYRSGIGPNDEAGSALMSTSTSSFWGDIGDTFSGIADSVTDLAKQGLSAWSSYQDASTAIKIQKERNAAIERQYAAAPDTVKITAPSAADAVQNQQQYGSGLAQTLGLGALTQNSGNIALIAGGAFLLWALAKGK